MAYPLVTVSDSSGQPQEYSLIETSEENDVPYAVVSPVGHEEDPDDYLVYGYDDTDGELQYFPLPPEVTARLLRHLRDRIEIDQLFFQLSWTVGLA